jgi:hypothetical protein
MQCGRRVQQAFERNLLPPTSGFLGEQVLHWRVQKLKINDDRQNGNVRVTLILWRLRLTILAMEMQQFVPFVLMIYK